jgi:cobalt-precorrin-5B (C1)-methyltransferase
MSAYSSEPDDDETAAEAEVVPPRQRRGLRRGFTTGACATAAALAAARALASGRRARSETIHLPAGMDATFRLHRFRLGRGQAFASVIKDAGDDPDVTHGAEICARVRWVEQPGIHLKGGHGVGTVTRQGLGLEVGGPAINPVPQRMLNEHLSGLLGNRLEQQGLEVTIEVPRGEEMAKKTLNGRLGIVGGISILGTTGIVVPYSTAAWRASVEQAIDVAAANGQRRVVLSTGGRSEQFAMALLPDLPEVAFVEMGEFTGHCLKRCARLGLERASLAGMVGKMSKIAMGHFMTHVAANQVDLLFLSDLAAECGASRAVVEEIREANTARHFQEIAMANSLRAVFGRLAEEVCARSVQLVNGALVVDCFVFDFDGTLLGEATAGGDCYGEMGRSGDGEKRPPTNEGTRS